MKLDLQQVSYFLYWMKERHQIHLRRMAGESKPWTTDRVLRNYFFTNPFRENDKTTRWFRKWVRDPLQDSPKVLMATFIFRRFNYIPTGQILLKEGLLENWDSRHCRAVLEHQDKVFTGAYMISSPGGKLKLPEICRMIDDCWARRGVLQAELERANTLEAGFNALQMEHHRGLLPYEVVTDLRWTYLLRDAADKDTWAFFGPGGQRGARRMLGLPVLRTPKGKQRATSLEQQVCCQVGAELLAIVRESFAEDEVMRACVTPNDDTASQNVFELRDIEHSLCETDKYLRMCAGDGRSKRLYEGE